MSQKIAKPTIPILRSAEELAALRRANQAAASCLQMIAPFVVPGVSTLELNDRIDEYIQTKLGALPATLGYRGFPKSCCISPNNVVCHGIPSSRVRLRRGDIANVDVALQLDGFFGDTSMTFIIGERTKPYISKLVQVTRECLFLGIKAVRPGGRLGDIGHAIARHAHKNGFSVVTEYCGHGIGREFHLEPQVVHDAKRGTGPKLRPGMCFTIEPMINAGKSAVRVLNDGWTAITADGQPSAQWEHSVLVTQGGCEVLSLRVGEQAPGAQASRLPCSNERVSARP